LPNSFSVFPSKIAATSANPPWQATVERYRAGCRREFLLTIKLESGQTNVGG
jgi:hypothetical protein